MPDRVGLSDRLPRCPICGEEAPYGDARLAWLSRHESRLHRRAHLRYAGYVVRHKWFVFRAGLKTGAPLWRLLVHDWSKLSRAEWTPYVHSFYRPDIPSEAKQAAFDAAWLHHQHRNPHHWQHWLLQEDDGPRRVLPMPDHFIREMVADWMGAGRAITGKWEVVEWYRQNAKKIRLEALTRDCVHELLGIPPAHSFDLEGAAE